MAGFLGHVQAVSRFGFHPGGTHGQGFGPTFTHRGRQLLVVQGTGGGGGHGNAAGRIVLPRHPGNEFIGPIAAEDQVAVRIDPSGKHCTPAQVVGLLGLRGLPGRAGPGDETVFDQYRGIGKNRPVGIDGIELGNICQQQACHKFPFHVLKRLQRCPAGGWTPLVRPYRIGWTGSGPGQRHASGIPDKGGDYASWVTACRESMNACTQRSMSSAECAAESCTRMRAWPLGTTG